jgi:hypothetical protein
MSKRILAAMLLAFASGAALVGAAPARAEVTSHPRLWIGAGDITRLRGWATSANPMYKNGLHAAALAAKATADAAWDWNTGVPNGSWNDTGSSNWEGEATEAYAEMFAFMSRIDPDAAARLQWAMRARAMLMWAMNQAALGPAAGQPFRDPAFITYNRGNYWGEAWGLTVDWIYGHLSATDKATIRKAFLTWEGQLLVAATAGEEHPQPVGVYDDLTLIGSSPSQSAGAQENAQLQARWAANNYFIGHMRNMTLMALSLDAADDPAIDPAKPRNALGNSLHSYVRDVTGAWLYQVYALFETPAKVAKKLGAPLSNPNLGLANGGLPVEGSLYGESLGYLFQALLALKTAGRDDPAVDGPQIKFIDSPFWDEALQGFLHQMSPAAAVPTDPNYAYLGPLYAPATYGDNLRDWVTYENIELFGPIGAYDHLTGNHDRLQQEYWIATNALEGGAAALYSRAADVWGNSNASYSIYYFLMFGAKARDPVDPRPALPTQFVAPAIGRILARSDWGPNASWFTFRCGWETINHESGDCMQFEFYRKGQWLTKEWSGYAIDWMDYTPLYHNTLSVQNTIPANLPGSIYVETSAYGGQWNNGGSYGDPTVTMSVNDNWAYALADATVLYNHPDWWTAADSAVDVTGASRSIVWLNPDHIVVYDRADSASAGKFKRFNLDLTAAPSIVGGMAEATVGGQTLTVRSLLPVNASVYEQHFWTTDPSQEFDAPSELETARDRLVIEDKSNPKSTRFLTVLQGTDSGTAADGAAAVASTGGTAYEGAVVKDTVVMFPVSLGGAVASTRYQVPASVARHLITGLTPGAGYTVATATADGTTTVAVTAGGSVTADIGGVIAIGFPSSAAPTLGGVKAGWTLTNPND